MSSRLSWERSRHCPYGHRARRSGVPSTLRESARLEWCNGDAGRSRPACRGLPRRTRTAGARPGRSADRRTGRDRRSAARRCSSRPRRRVRHGRRHPPGRRARRRPSPTWWRWSTNTAPAGRPPATEPRRGLAAGAVAAELEPAAARGGRGRRSGRRSPAATSTRSTSSATPSAAYPGDPLPALRRVAALPGARYGGVLRRRRLGGRLRLAGDPGRGAPAAGW